MEPSLHLTKKELAAIWGKIDSGAFLFNRINRLTEQFTYLFATLLLAVISAADYFSHVELMLSPFYALPCLLVDWRIGRSPAIMYGLFASAIQCLIGLFGGHPYSSNIFLYWDILVNILFYGFLIWVVAKLRVALEMERALSRVDFLTKLANRKTLQESLEIEYQRCRRYGHILTIALIDCDNFTVFIDERGFSTGDMLLGAAANTLTESFRTTDFMARTGSNEFAVILAETPFDSSAAKLAKLHKQLELATLSRGWPVTFSIACVTYGRVPESAATALADARALLRHIKQSGKNRLEQKTFAADAIAADSQPTRPVVHAGFAKGKAGNGPDGQLQGA